MIRSTFSSSTYETVELTPPSLNRSQTLKASSIKFGVEASPTPRPPDDPVPPPWPDAARTRPWRRAEDPPGRRRWRRRARHWRRRRRRGPPATTAHGSAGQSATPRRPAPLGCRRRRGLLASARALAAPARPGRRLLAPPRSVRRAPGCGPRNTRSGSPPAPVSRPLGAVLLFLGLLRGSLTPRPRPLVAAPAPGTCVAAATAAAPARPRRRAASQAGAGPLRPDSPEPAAAVTTTTTTARRLAPPPPPPT